MYIDEYYTMQFLTGLAMVSARKYVQSVEFFRQIQRHIFNNIHNIPDEIQDQFKSRQNPYTNLIYDENQPMCKSFNNTSNDANVIKTDKLNFKALIQRAAKFEILIADCWSQHSQLKEKIEAFKRATLLYRIKSIDEFKEKIPANSYNSLNKSFHQSKIIMSQYIQEEDIYTELLKLQPDLIDWILQNLNENDEPIRVAFLKSLEFLIDTIGCSLGDYIWKILKSIIKHVNLTHSQNSNNFNSRKMFNQTLKNIYNHFLESFLSVLSSLSSDILLKLFNDVLYPTIMQFKFDNGGNIGIENNNEIFASDIWIYLLKITDKIINIWKGDILLNDDFLSIIFTEVTQKNKSGTVHLAVQNLWQSLINNVFVNYSGKEINNITKWISIQISYLKDKAEEIIDYDLNQLNVIFELIYLISTNSKTNEEGYLFRHNTQETSDHYSGDSKVGINEDGSLIITQAKNV